jgi:hypothetical protein
VVAVPDAEVRLNEAELYRVLESPAGPVAARARALLAVGEQTARQYAPVKTGNLRAHIVARAPDPHRGRGLTADLVSTVPYATYQERFHHYMRRAALEIERKGS